MTFREKLQMEHPEYVNGNFDGGCKNCPDTYGYEEKSKCDGTNRNCYYCWNREMPNTEFKQKVANPPTQEVLDELHKNIKTIPQSEVDAYNQGHADGMAQGMSDVWECLKRATQYTEKIDIFGCTTLSKIVNKLTPQEALAKMKAYEEQKKIEVGDIVVIPPNEIAVVTKEKEKDVYVCFSDGSGGYFKKDACKKIGKHIDIKSILEQIGE